ncbi:MAG: cell division protein FtsA [Patescibacteria group bacterium]
MKDEILVGIDLGSSRIRIAVGQVSLSDNRRTSVNIIGLTESPSNGFSKGCITSLEDAVSAISSSLEQTERLVGVPIQSALVGIGGSHITASKAKGVIGVSRPDGEIRKEDVDRAIESARAGANPANMEILHLLPQRFTVDGQKDIKDPIGMQGIRLEADVLVVQGLTSHVKNITRAVFRTRLDIDELVYAPLAAAEAVLTSRQKELGVCVLCIGASTSGLTVYEDGELLHATTIGIGSDHITSDVAIGLRVALDVAEVIKRERGSAVPEDVGRRDEIDVQEYGADQSEIVSIQYISEIIEARVEELLEKVEDELKKIDRSGMLPAGIVFTGGGAKLSGLIHVAKRILQLPAFVGQAQVQSSLPELAHDPAYSTAVGLVQWGFESIRNQETFRPNWNSGSHKKGILQSIIGPIKKIGKSFMP